MTLAPDTVDSLAAELKASDSATAVLQRRCATGAITAAVDRAVSLVPSPAQRRALAVTSREEVSYRRVRLMCGSVVLSTAENWYVPARLTAAMRSALAGDAAFGAVIRPLRPRRTTRSVARLGDDPVLRVEAVVIGADRRPLAYVIETYAAAVLR